MHPLWVLGSYFIYSLKKKKKGGGDKTFMHSYVKKIHRFTKFYLDLRRGLFVLWGLMPFKQRDENQQKHSKFELVSLLKYFHT